MPIEIIGTVYEGNGLYGDFEHMIKSGKYENSLFIFNDNEISHQTCDKGRGNAIIRKYNRFSSLDKPYSAGIVTGEKPIKNGGYRRFDLDTKQKIDECITEIKLLIEKNKYERIFYSAEEENGVIGTSIFKVDIGVLNYITQEIWKLTN